MCITGLMSGTSSKGAPCVVQDASYSLEIAATAAAIKFAQDGSAGTHGCEVKGSGTRQVTAFERTHHSGRSDSFDKELLFSPSCLL
ncbi:UNVERIFIED_CONTAM: hypothetical protein FKN15_076093 [Acipenser sinensis]